MSIMKITQAGVTNRQKINLKWTIFANTLLLSIIMLSTLDLFFATLRNDSLANFTMYVLTDLMLTLIALIFSLDLLAKGSDSVKTFLAYMLFLWICVTILKTVILL